jgi:RHS repeat-associated protein
MQDLTPSFGTVTDVTNAGGSAEWKYEYEAYGAERTITNISGTAPENKLRFAGEYLDGASTYYYLRARDYDTSSGRFGGIDPIQNRLETPTTGAYAYVDGRPTVMIDPTGLNGWDRIKAGARAAKDVTVATARFVDDSLTSAESSMNPVGAFRVLRGFGEQGYNTVQGCRKGARACYDAINENLNPMFSVAVAGDQCIFHGDLSSRTYNCLSAGRDTALAGFGIFAVGRLCGLGSRAPEAGGASSPRFVAANEGIIDTVSPALKSQIDDVADSVMSTGRPPAGVRQGGLPGKPGVYGNKNGALPSKPEGYYTETDVWAGTGPRGTERLVIGRNGEVWYTPDHYGTFRRIR